MKGFKSDLVLSGFASMVLLAFVVARCNQGPLIVQLPLKPAMSQADSLTTYLQRDVLVGDLIETRQGTYLVTSVTSEDYLNETIWLTDTHGDHRSWDKVNFPTVAGNIKNIIHLPDMAVTNP